MKFSEDYGIGTNVIRAITDTGIEINNKAYENSLIVSRNLLIDDWGIKHLDQISLKHWQQIVGYQPEVILIGTGPTLIFPPPASYAPAIDQGIGVEFMDSAAACRTYNVLVSEDRFVIAAIIL